MNYTALKQNIKDWMENDSTEFDAECDNFIAIAERRIHLDVDLPIARKYNSSLTMAAGTDTLDMPSDFQVTRWVAISVSTDKKFLLKKDVSFIRDFWPSTTARGEPRYYADYDNNTLIFAPRPDQNYAVELSYNFFPTSIVTATNTWVGDNAEHLLLYACLVEAALFEKMNSDKINEWMGKYKEALDKVALRYNGVIRRTDEQRGGESRG